MLDFSQIAGFEHITYKPGGNPWDIFEMGWAYDQLKRDRVPEYFQFCRTAIYRLATNINAKNIVELGVREGYSTTAFSAHLNRRGGSLTSFDPVWSEDLFRKENLEECDWAYYEMTGEEGYMRYGSVIINVDLLYIDTDPHTYDQTKMWLHDYWIHNVRPGGYIVLDDCSPYFQRGIDQQRVPQEVNGYRLMNVGEWGVLQAILEFVDEQNDKIEFAFSVWNHSSPGTAIIKLKEGCKYDRS
jgi:predicted O-methyltransferase YrrM